MRNAGLEEAQAGIKIARRNINNLRYADDTTLMAESKEEPKSLLMKVKEESEKIGLKLNIQKTKIMTSGPISSLQIDGEAMWATPFLLRSKHLLISWLQSPFAVILEPKKMKSLTVSIVSPSICHEVMGPDAMIFVFGMLNFKPAFSFSSFIKKLFSSSLLSAIRVVSSA